MHPAVDISNLRRLPVKQRTMAKNACQADASLNDLRTLHALAQTASSAPHRLLYLPVFYTHLNPDLIPTAGDWDSSPSAELILRLARATTSWHGVIDVLLTARTNSFADIRADVWPRVWAWALFMHEHNEHMPEQAKLSDAFLYNSIVIFGAQVSDKNLALVSSTAGFRTILGKAWALAPDRGSNNEMFGLFFFGLARLLGSLPFMDPAHFKELADGAGGTLDDLARLGVQYLHDLMEHTPPPNSTPVHLPSLINFVLVPDTPGIARNPMRDEFIALLPGHGFIPPFINVLEAYLARGAINGGDLPQMALVLIERLISLPHGYQFLPSAIKAGLLRVLARITLLYSAAASDNMIRYFTQRHLPLATAHYQVAVSVSEAWKDITKITSSKEFRANRLFKEWQVCLGVLETRMKVLREIETVKDSRACDNLKCGKIQEKPSLRRCSQCRAAYYCNRECQLADWEQSGHRAFCGVDKVLSLADSGSNPATYNERKFLRHLLHRAYTDKFHEICQIYANFTASSADESFMLFDLTTDFHPKVSVESVTNSETVYELEQAGASEWASFVSRARASRMHMQLHVAKIAEGKQHRFWVVPLRCSSSFVYKEVKAMASIARRWPMSGMNLETEVEIILKRRPNNEVEIH
ncbi:hypothetical protein R3P38DRAFT_3575255 [Favolaschia claudopus]|uniref:MYND-type domain-containing protein n=1 Tax=Favolaschia claudopus TaxID=2862362 RepID=A0AAW0AP21_9AGAR